MRSWFAIYCRCQFERTVEKGLELAGVESFYPFYFVSTRWSDRSKQVEKPLFPGYLFARFEPTAENEQLVHHVHGVVGVLRTPSGPLPIPDGEIQVVRRLIDSGLALTVVENSPHFELGQRVVVKYGMLMGAEGHVTRIKGNLRLVITTTALNRATLVEVDAASLQAIDEKKKAA